MTTAHIALLFVIVLNVSAFAIIAYRCRHLPITDDATPLEQALTRDPSLLDNPDHSFEAPGEWPPWGQATDAQKWARVAEMIRQQPATAVQTCRYCGRLMPNGFDKTIACGKCGVWQG